MRDTPASRLTPDEWRLIRFFRCLSDEQQYDALFNTASTAVQRCLTEDQRLNGFAELRPDPPDGYTRGGINEEWTMDHLMYCAVQETGDAEAALLGSSFYDDDLIGRITWRMKEEATRQGNNYFDSSPESARSLLEGWRLEIVNACESRVPEANETT